MLSQIILYNRYRSHVDLYTTNYANSHDIMPPLIMLLLPGSKVCWIPRRRPVGRVRAEEATDVCQDKPAGCSGQGCSHIPKNHMPVHVSFYFFIQRCNIQKHSVNIDGLFPSICLQPLVEVTEIPNRVTDAETAIRQFKACKDAGQLGWKPWCLKTWLVGPGGFLRSWNERVGIQLDVVFGYVGDATGMPMAHKEQTIISISFLAGPERHQIR